METKFYHIHSPKHSSAAGRSHLFPNDFPREYPQRPQAPDFPFKRELIAMSRRNDFA
jgi:hypothetical protein